MRANVHDLGFGKGFLGMTPKIWVTKGKIDKLHVIKFRTFVLQKTSSNNESNIFKSSIW